MAREAVALEERLALGGDGRHAFLVQEMAEPGLELLVGVVSDPDFGPVLACGAGGTQAELLGDVGVRICSITRRDAAEVICSLATFPLLTGSGAAPSPRLGARRPAAAGKRHGYAHHEIVELDLNPVIAGAMAPSPSTHG